MMEPLERLPCGGDNAATAGYVAFDATRDRSVSFKVCYTFLEKTSWSLFKVPRRGRAMTKGGDTRREIVEKAAPLFNQKGFEGTSLSDLMRVTGLQKGGIYRHFSSKEELAGEAFDYAWQKAFERRLEGIDEAGGAGGGLRKMITNVVDI